MTRRRRQSAVAASLGLLLVAGVLAGVSGTGSPVASAGRAGEGELPAGLSAHLAKLKQAVPGNAGESEDGPGSRAAASFRAHAYPKQNISLKKLNAAAAAFEKAQAKSVRPSATLGTAAAQAQQAAEWQKVGPRKAIYPLTRFRNFTNYVPNKYVAGGRTTSITVSNVCRERDCRMWVTPAGGGIWRTENGLKGDPKWKYLGGPLGINAAGSVAVDHNDPDGDTIYVGTGEANICGSGCVAGVGLYKSTNGGDTWRGPLGKNKLGGKGIGEIIVKPGKSKVIYAATTTALRGMSSTCCSGVVRPVPGAAKWGLFKSTNGGHSWRFIHNGSSDRDDCTGSLDEFSNLETCSPRGVRHLVLDPSNPKVLYASSYARGIWRSKDNGRSWTQIKESLNNLVIQSRAAIAVTTLANGDTRMYVHEGNFGDPYSRLFRSDDVRQGDPSFTDLTSDDPADPGYATYNQCGGQCWYDLFVYTPEGFPDVVYTGGSYVYDETAGISNGRGVVLSTDAGVSGTDMTMDGTDDFHPNGLHPDQHALITKPGKPFRFIEVNDGGISGSNGSFTDASAQCADRGLDGVELARCQQLLSRVPAKLDGKNDGLNTLQFISLSVSPHDSDLLQGGTQDNGTWQSDGDRKTWFNTMAGDGGASGFDVDDPSFRFHNFFDVTPEVQFSNGDIGKWIWTADPLFGIPNNEFYSPVISDPRVSGTMFAGTGFTVHRTKTHGLGDRSRAEAQRICNTWTGTFEEQCGDWVEIGSVRLSSDEFGDREDGAVVAVERTKADTSSAWAATETGRLFVSKNVDAEPAGDVEWTRIDSADTPNRFISSIYVDPDNGNRAWVSYSGYNLSTPDTPGHVFKVVYDPASGTAEWTNLSHDLEDLPVTDLVRDDVTGDLYAASDFGVVRLAAGTSTWTKAAQGMPNVEVPGLTILPEERILYAASHGLSAWRLNLH